MDLALNNLYWLICHKTKPNQKEWPNRIWPLGVISPREPIHRFKNLQYIKQSMGNKGGEMHNIAFLRSQKIVKSYIKFITYANAAQRANIMNNKNNQSDKNRTFIKDIVQLRLNESKFQGQFLKNTLSWNQTNYKENPQQSPI